VKERTETIRREFEEGMMRNVMGRSGVGVGVVMAVAFTLAMTGKGSAQIRASERGSVSQTLDGTSITVDYSRPRARGRVLFGGVVPWGVVWTPGANWATRLETDRPIRINGVDVAAGDYSVWMIPREDRWTLTLHDEPEYFHFQKPDSALGAVQIEVVPEEGKHVEMLTWSFPTVTGDAAVLELAWGDTRIPMQVLVEPSRPVVLAAEERTRYLGVYALEIAPGIGWPLEGELRVTEGGDGMLRGWMSFPLHPGDELAFDMVPAGRDRFHAGLYRDGRLFNVETGVSFEFHSDEPDAPLILRGIEGSPFGVGTRAEAAERR
jgi:hypothetical protein